jgi:hypothetical protein
MLLATEAEATEAEAADAEATEAEATEAQPLGLQLLTVAVIWGRACNGLLTFGFELVFSAS